jgi:hypothetical protein
MTASPMALAGPTVTAPSTPIRWERGMRLLVTPGVRVLHLDRSIITTIARGGRGLYLGGTPARAHVALERVGLVVVDTEDITPIR